MNDKIIDASIDPLGIGPVTGARIAHQWITQDYDAAWDRKIWDDVGHSPASIWYHYGDVDSLSWHHRIVKYAVAGE